MKFLLGHKMNCYLVGMGRDKYQVFGESTLLNVFESCVVFIDLRVANNKLNSTIS